MYHEILYLRLIGLLERRCKVHCVTSRSECCNLLDVLVLCSAAPVLPTGLVFRASASLCRGTGSVSSSQVQVLHRLRSPVLFVVVFSEVAGCRKQRLQVVES